MSNIYSFNKDKLFREGFILLKRFYAFEEIQGMKENLGELIISEIKQKNLHLSKMNLLKLVINQKLSHLLQTIYEDDFVCIQLSFDPKKPGAKGHKLHRDNFFVETKGGGLVSSFIAMEKADKSNGCLYFLKERNQFSIFNEKEMNNLEDYSGCLDIKDSNYETFHKAFIPIKLERGDLVIWLGDTLHGSDRNNSSKTRNSILAHFINKNTKSINKNYLPAVEKDGNLYIFKE